MSKPILIVGHLDSGNTALSKFLSDKGLSENDVIIYTPEEAIKNGIELPTMEIKPIEIKEFKCEPIFKPKKLHPKHQKHNKYRHK